MKVVRGALVQFLAAFAGLLCYLVLASLIGWVDPIWWGGEALFPLGFGSIALLIGAVPSYGICLKILKVARKVEIVLYRHIVITGFLQGILFVVSFSLYLRLANFSAFRYLISQLQQVDIWIPILVALGAAVLLSAVFSALLVLVVLRVFTTASDHSS